jgi:ribonucleoside-triphosphate reductase
MASGRAAVGDANDDFSTDLQRFQFFDKYSRVDYETGQHETWTRCVDRAVDYLHDLAGSRLDAKTYARIRRGILTMAVMPSMRLLAMAGPAARRDSTTIYNCAYLPVDSISAFVEAALLSMNGCGVGYSVEREYLGRLPPVKVQKGRHRGTLKIEDTTEGWACAVASGLEAWFDGEDIGFDYTDIRPAGAPLRIKGGTASGPDVLRRTLDLLRERVLHRQGARVSSLDAHDMMCSLAGVPIAGGVRPGVAMLSLFDFDDEEMRLCKADDFDRDNPQRRNANNSMVLPDRGMRKDEWAAYFRDLHYHRRGEPGVFNRRAAIGARPYRRAAAAFGTNPCGETVLRPWQLCNLSSAIARRDDDLSGLVDKVELAAIIGTIQSLATNFPGLRPRWRENAVEERLLGVDISGQMDSPLVRASGVQAYLARLARDVNARMAPALGIERAAAVTCVKPSGNSSELLGCSAGLHARWSSHYVRNVRVSASSPTFDVLREANVEMSPETGRSTASSGTWVVPFVVATPCESITRGARSAVEQCEYWLQVTGHWTEHNASCTIVYKPDEIGDLVDWVWRHDGVIGGLTFLPATDANYELMPYVEISSSEYEERVARSPGLDFSSLASPRRHACETDDAQAPKP